MSNKGKVFILNKPFEGSYTDNEGNVAHEIINYFRADNGNVYIYNNPLGHCPENIDADRPNDYKVEYMFLAKKAIMNKKNVICKRVMNYFDSIASFESNVSL